MAALLGLACCFMALAAAPGTARAQPGAKPSGMLGDFRKLADMRPRRCPAGEPPASPSSAWRTSGNDCAWQGRLRLQRWASGPRDASACLSAAAQWWGWARRSLRGSVVLAPAWHASWTSQAFSAADPGTEQLALIAQEPDGTWSAKQWTWKPSPRPATRRWQEQRWRKLVAEAMVHAQPIPATQPGKGIRALRQAWERSLGNRAGEIHADRWQWAGAGRCFTADKMGVDEGKFQLPYMREDSRLEQRAAMQLQLARRHPDAVWIKPFGLVEGASAGQGGARYMALWQDQSAVRGQLWVPTKSDGPVLHLRMSTPLANASATAAAALERELHALSQSWGANE